LASELVVPTKDCLFGLWLVGVWNKQGRTPISILITAETMAKSTVPYAWCRFNTTMWSPQSHVAL
jgi:hypothetical protein